MTDWATTSSLATVGGTLVLAVATFAFALTPRDGDGSWLCSISKVWNLDRPDPR